jgi:hypothetical protein
MFDVSHPASPGARRRRYLLAGFLTPNVNFPIVRITAMYCGQSLTGPQTGLIVSTIRPWNVPAHHEWPARGTSFALTRAPFRSAPTDANALDWQPRRAVA